MMTGERLENRVLVVAAPDESGRLLDTLRSSAIAVLVCRAGPELVAELGRGAAAVLVTRRGTSAIGVDVIATMIDEQPYWSDLPVFVVDDADERWLGSFRDHVDAMPIPPDPPSIVSALRSAIRLRRAQHRLRDQTEFLGRLAHELANPMTPIRYSSELLRQNPTDPQHVIRIAGMLERQVSQVDHLIDDLLVVSRLSRQTTELRWTRTDLLEVIGAAIDTAGPRIAGAGHVPDIDLPGVPVDIEMDRAMLTRVFTTLLSAASALMERPGRVALSVKRSSGRVMVSIRATESGVADDALEHLFDMSMQDGPPHWAGGSTLGTELWAAKRIVELHQGTLEARRADGPGIELLVTLPET